MKTKVQGEEEIGEEENVVGERERERGREVEVERGGRKEWKRE